MRLRVLSYNIHKGFTAGRSRYVLDRMKRSIEDSRADLVLLQEVLGRHAKHASRISDWPSSSQFEFLADRVWPHFAYGKNVVYTDGHHGNAILSKYPITFWENIDVSTYRLEQRGILHAAIDVPTCKEPVHAICLHFGLFERHRGAQIAMLAERIRRKIPAAAALVVGGDFNDWREQAGLDSDTTLGLQEVFFEMTGRHARTFPAFAPFLPLDRIYSRGFVPVSAEVLHGAHWDDLSDHAPILVEIEIESGKIRSL